jgi:hypothetical protein
MLIQMAIGRLCESLWEMRRPYGHHESAPRSQQFWLLAPRWSIQYQFNIDGFGRNPKKPWEEIQRDQFAGMIDQIGNRGSRVIVAFYFV